MNLLRWLTGSSRRPEPTFVLTERQFMSLMETFDASCSLIKKMKDVSGSPEYQMLLAAAAKANGGEYQGPKLHDETARLGHSLLAVQNAFGVKNEEHPTSR